ncbi:MAG: hypothetical protein R3B91_13360 [Planctomycetaceae bacterium]
MQGTDHVPVCRGKAHRAFIHPIGRSRPAELGIDISQQVSKHINEFLPPHGTPPDLIISVCSSAERECPIFPGNERLHWPFHDPAYATGGGMGTEGGVSPRAGWDLH